MIECKSTVEDRIYFSTLMARSHQHASLTKFVRSHETNMAGFVCQVGNDFTYVPVEKVQGEGSVHREWALANGLYWGPFNLGEMIR